ALDADFDLREPTRCELASQLPAHALHGTYHQRVPHQERPSSIRETSRPIVGESVQTLQLDRRQSAELTARGLDDVLEAGGARAPFARKDRPGGAIQRIGKRNRALRVRVLPSAGAVGSRLLLRTLEVSPGGKLLSTDEESLRYVSLG